MDKPGGLTVEQDDISDPENVTPRAAQGLDKDTI